MIKENMNIVIVGHVDHGKSTIIGRLLADTNSLPEGKIEQVKETCRSNSRPFEYAFLLDALKDEQAQGITIDSARVFFKTKKRDYIIIDAPGHIEFLKNMVTGASRADAALLVIAANEGIMENTKRHAYLLSMLGIKQICVLVNKMDLMDYKKERFDEIVKTYKQFLKEIGIESKAFIPISGIMGDNVYKQMGNMPWYQDKTVLEMLDSFHTLKNEKELPFRMSVQDIYKFTRNSDDRRIIAGTIDEGSISIGDKIIFYPSGKKSTIKSIEAFGTEKPRSVSKDNAVGFVLEEQIYINRGELACKEGEMKPKITTRFMTNLFWLGKKSLIKDKKYLLKIGTNKVSVQVEKIIKVIDTGSLEERVNDQVKRHEVAEIILKTEKAIAFDLVSEMEKTCRFVLVDEYEIAGGGTIIESLPDDVSWLRDKVQLRREKWVNGYVSIIQRAQRYNQRPTLIIITGKKEIDRKTYAAELERILFKEGKYAYFISLGNFIYGIDGDIKELESNYNDEHFRRLAELSNILLSAGQILIVSAQEISKKELNIFRESIDDDMVECIWIGDGAPEQTKYSIVISEKIDPYTLGVIIMEYLQEKGIFFSLPNSMK